MHYIIQNLIHVYKYSDKQTCNIYAKCVSCTVSEPIYSCLGWKEEQFYQRCFQGEYQILCCKKWFFSKIYLLVFDFSHLMYMYLYYPCNKLIKNAKLIFQRIIYYKYMHQCHQMTIEYLLVDRRFERKGFVCCWEKCTWIS